MLGETPSLAGSSGGCWLLGQLATVLLALSCLSLLLSATVPAVLPCLTLLLSLDLSMLLFLSSDLFQHLVGTEV